MFKEIKRTIWKIDFLINIFQHALTLLLVINNMNLGASFSKSGKDRDISKFLNLKFVKHVKLLNDAVLNVFVNVNSNFEAQVA